MKRRSRRTRRASLAKFEIPKKVPLWFWLGIGAGAAYILFSKNADEGGNSITDLIEGGSVTGAVDLATFTARLPVAGQQYAPIFWRVGQENNINPAILAAICERETNYGTAHGLSVQGPTGTGDAGHGHGLMQIDDRSWAPWLAKNDWTDPYTNITKGAEILKGKIRTLAGNAAITGASPSKTDGTTVTILTNKALVAKFLTGPLPQAFPDKRPLVGYDLLEGGIAAYNTGELNVIDALACGFEADKTTTGGDYAQSVLGFAQKYNGGGGFDSVSEPLV